MVDGLFSLTASRLGSSWVKLANEMVQNKQDGSEKKSRSTHIKWWSVKFTAGVSVGMEERRVETKRRVSGQLTVGDKFKGTKSRWRMCVWNSEGEESRSQTGHQGKKKNTHILSRELTSWTAKLHWHMMRGMMQGGREERKAAKRTAEDREETL